MPSAYDRYNQGSAPLPPNNEIVSTKRPTRTLDENGNTETEEQLRNRDRLSEARQNSYQDLGPNGQVAPPSGIDQAAFAKSVTRLRSLLADDNSHYFRYGMWESERRDLSNWADAEYEDPIRIGFTLDIDTNDINSPLFNMNVDSSIQNPYQQRGLAYFLNTYKDYNKEIKYRVDIHKKFVQLIQQFFKTHESIRFSALDNPKATGGSPVENFYMKGHYINTISGLDKLQRRIQPQDGDNFIEVEMQEDQRMMAGYLAFLYNTMTYSYARQKELIPKNLLRFRLHIKFSEVRNFTSIRKMLDAFNGDTSDPYEIVYNIRNNVTSMVYTLHNCWFDFSETKNFGDSITVAGFGASMPDFSTQKFKIYFDSVSRRFNPALLDYEVKNGDVRVIQYDDKYLDMGNYFTQQAIEEQLEFQQQADDAIASTDRPRRNNPQQRPVEDVENRPDPFPFGRTNFGGKEVNGTSLRLDDDETLAKKYYDPRGLVNKFATAEAIAPNNQNFQEQENFDILSQTTKPGQKPQTLDDVGAAENPREQRLQNFRDTINADIERRKAELAQTFNPESIVANARGALEDNFQRFTDELRRQINNRRARLVNTLIQDVRASTGVSQITPKNVYDRANILELYLQRLKNEIGLDVTRRLGEGANTLLGL